MAEAEGTWDIQPITALFCLPVIVSRPLPKLPASPGFRQSTDNLSLPLAHVPLDAYAVPWDPQASEHPSLSLTEGIPLEHRLWGSTSHERLALLNLSQPQFPICPLGCTDKSDWFL